MTLCFAWHGRTLYSSLPYCVEEILLSGSCDGSILVWDVQNYCLISQLCEHEGFVLAIAAITLTLTLTLIA